MFHFLDISDDQHNNNVIFSLHMLQMQHYAKIYSNCHNQVVHKIVVLDFEMYTVYTCIQKKNLTTTPPNQFITNFGDSVNVQTHIDIYKFSFTGTSLCMASNTDTLASRIQNIKLLTFVTLPSKLFLAAQSTLPNYMSINLAAGDQNL